MAPSPPGAPTRLADKIAPGTLSPASLFVGLLLSADLLLIALHLMHISVQVRMRLPVVKAPAFDLARDLGLAEAFGYVKLFWVVLLLVWLGTLGLRRSYLPWALLYGYLLVDDMFSVHEGVGATLVRATGDDPDRSIVSGLRAQDAGELAVSSSVGLVVLVMLVLCYRRGAARTRAAYRHLAVATLVLATFGVAVDLVARVFESHTVQLVLYVVEDGGELIAFTGVLGYVVFLAEWTRPGAPADRRAPVGYRA